MPFGSFKKTLLPVDQDNAWLDGLLAEYCVRLSNVISFSNDQLPRSEESAEAIRTLLNLKRLVLSSHRARNYTQAYQIICQIYVYCKNIGASFPAAEKRSARRLLSQCEDLKLPLRVIRKLDSITDVFFQKFKSKFNKPTVPSTSALPGVAIIHRIWLGSYPSEERMVRVAASNKNIERRWGKKVRHILWTDNKGLLAQSDKLLLGVFEIHNVEKLMNAANSMSNLGYFAKSFLAWKQYSYSCDVLRMIALYFFGGLYLDFTWVSCFLFQGRPFNPSQSDVKIYSEPIKNQTVPLAFSCDSRSITNALTTSFKYKNQISRYSPWVSNQMVDTNIAYSGSAISPYFHDLIMQINDGFLSNAFRKSYQDVLKLTHKNKGLHGSFMYEDIASNLTPTIIVIVAGIYPASMKHLYNMVSPLEFALPSHHSFAVSGSLLHLYVIEALGLVKLKGLSWAKVNAKLQGSIEAP